MQLERDRAGMSKIVKIVALLIMSWSANSPSYGQNEPTEGEHVKTEIYFGSNLGAGAIVSKRRWDEFVSHAVTTRFPTGLTVIDATGEGRRSGLTAVRILVIVHPRSAEWDVQLKDLKMEYRKRFRSAGVFQIDQVVTVRP
jgi:hypothetical protein